MLIIYTTYAPPSKQLALKLIIVDGQEVVCCVMDIDVMCCSWLANLGQHHIGSQCVQSVVGSKFSSYYWWAC